MDDAESIRQAMYEACKARDVMWDVVLKELEFRNAPAAREAREEAQGMRVRPMVGFSTWAAALAWRHLDYRARRDWLWVCQGTHQIWVRGVMESAGMIPTATKPAMVEGIAAKHATMEPSTAEPAAPKPTAPEPTTPEPARVKPNR